MLKCSLLYHFYDLDQWHRCLQREVTKSNVVLPIEFIFQIHEVLFSQTPLEIKQQSLLHIE